MSDTTLFIICVVCVVIGFLACFGYESYNQEMFTEAITAGCVGALGGVCVFIILIMLSNVFSMILSLLCIGVCLLFGILLVGCLLRCLWKFLNRLGRMK